MRFGVREIAATALLLMAAGGRQPFEGERDELFAKLARHGADRARVEATWNSFDLRPRPVALPDELEREDCPRPLMVRLWFVLEELPETRKLEESHRILLARYLCPFLLNDERREVYGLDDTEKEEAPRPRGRRPAAETNQLRDWLKLIAEKYGDRLPEYRGLEVVERETIDTLLRYLRDARAVIRRQAPNERVRERALEWVTARRDAQLHRREEDRALELRAFVAGLVAKYPVLPAWDDLTGAERKELERLVYWLKPADVVRYAAADRAVSDRLLEWLRVHRRRKQAMRPLPKELHEFVAYLLREYPGGPPEFSRLTAGEQMLFEALFQSNRRMRVRELTTDATLRARLDSYFDARVSPRRRELQGTIAAAEAGTGKLLCEAVEGYYKTAPSALRRDLVAVYAMRRAELRRRFFLRKALRPELVGIEGHLAHADRFHRGDMAAAYYSAMAALESGELGGLRWFIYLGTTTQYRSGVRRPGRLRSAPRCAIRVADSSESP